MERVGLYRSQDFEDSWEAILHPWFREQNLSRTASVGNAAVIVPHVSCIAFLKARLLEKESGTFRIYFFTSRTLREFLLRHLATLPPLVSREDARLFVSLVTEQISESRVAQAVSRSPDLFLHLLNQITGAGWKLRDWENQEAENIAHQFSRYLDLAGMQTVQQADRRLLRESEMVEPFFQRVLVYGFSEREWPQLLLLRAAVNFARRATVVLLEEGLDDAGRSWLGTWEEFFGDAETVASTRDKAESGFEAVTDNLEGLIESGVGESLPNQVIYRVTENRDDEAKTIVAQALTFLSESDSVRVGIVFSRPSALSRLVTDSLCRLRIPHYDSLGNVPGRNPIEKLLDIWIQLQQEQRLDSLLGFFCTLATEGFLDPKISTSLETIFENAAQEVLTDDLSVLKAFVLQERIESPAASFFSWWELFPKVAAIGTLVEWTERFLSLLDSPKLISNLQRKAKDLEPLREIEVSRDNFCQWLRDVFRDPQRIRNELGRNPFSRIHILSFDEFSGESWSHLIVGGLNSDEWPRRWVDSGLFSGDQIGKLNQLVLKRGRQGEGHVVVKGDHSWIHSSSDLRLSSFVHFTRLLRVPRRGLALTFSAERRTATLETIRPSEFLIKVYWVDRGSLLEGDELKALIEQTNGWLKGAFNKPLENSEENDRMLFAFKARRDPEKPFSEFEFSYREPPSGGLSLSASAWDILMERPAEVWLKHVLKLRKRQNWSEKMGFNLAHGSWVHSWLRIGNERGGFIPFPKADAWRASARHAANLTLGKVSLAYRKAGREVPDWWLSQWNEATEVAEQFLERLTSIAKWTYLASERPLPTNWTALLPNGTRLPIKGRMDLILANGPIDGCKRDDVWPADVSAWIIDFKTSSGARPLTSRNFSRGYGLQIGLYAQSLATMGCQSISMSIAIPHSALRPQISQEDLATANTLWQEISRLHKSGVVGQSSELRSNFSFKGDYPLATLKVDPAIIECKRTMKRSEQGIPD